MSSNNTNTNHQSSHSFAVTLPWIEKRLVTTYSPYIHCGPNVTVFLTSRIALIIDKEAGLEDLLHTDEAFHKFTLLLNALEQLLEQFISLTGKRPLRTHPYMGRIRIEVAYLPNAAGLAHHGVAGIAIGPAFVRGMIEKLTYDRNGVRPGGGIEDELINSLPSTDTLVGSSPSSSSSLPLPVPFIPRSSAYVTFERVYNVTIDHVCTYELMRNYIFPDEFTKVFDYCCREGDQCWGWVNQGFVNILGCLILPSHIDFTYYGHTNDSFCQSMVDHLDAYITNRKSSPKLSPFSSNVQSTSSAGLDTQYSWTDVFLNERLPWNNAVSLDNIYSGLLVTLYRNYGRNYFVYRFFNKAIPVLLQRCPSSKKDYVTAAENFYLAACIAAQRDLRDYFVDTLRWPLSTEFFGSNGSLVETLLTITS